MFIGHCWFALQVRPRAEKLIAQVLRDKGYEEFLPLYQSNRRWSSRSKVIELPLFPGYVFCRINLLVRAPILTTPGIIRIVGIGRTPSPIADHEIVALQNIVKSGLAAEPWPYPQTGDRVRVEGGPFQGIEGVVVRHKNRDRLVVSVVLLQRSVSVELDRRWVRSASGVHHPVSTANA